MKRKRRAKAREKHRKRIEDRLRGIDEFHVKFIDELNQAPEMPKSDPYRNSLLKRYEVTCCGGHAGRIKVLLISPYEKRLLSCSSEDVNLTLWNMQAHNEVGRLVGHDDAVVGGSISSDARLVATASRDGTLVIWDLSTQKILASLLHPKVVVCCSFACDNNTILSGCQDQICRVWDIKSGKEIGYLSGHKGIVMAICCTPNGMVLSGGSDRKVIVWNQSTQKSKLVFGWHINAIIGLDANPSGTMAVSIDEKIAYVWRVDDGIISLQLDAAKVCGGSRKALWNAVSFGPGFFHNVVVLGSSTRTLYFFGTDGKEELTILLRSSVSAIGKGPTRTIAAGDAFGNNYVITLF
jgi:WD40 repeat protein